MWESAPTGPCLLVLAVANRQTAVISSNREVVLRHQFHSIKALFIALMSILGEVCISHLRCIQRRVQDDGHTEVFDISCRLAGNAGGQAPIRASIHVHTTTFDGEEWRLITLMCSHYARYETLFAPSCGSVTFLTSNKMWLAILRFLQTCDITASMFED